MYFGVYFEIKCFEVELTVIKWNLFFSIYLMVFIFTRTKNDAIVCNISS